MAKLKPITEEFIISNVKKAEIAKFELGIDDEGFTTTYGIRSGSYFWKSINGNSTLKIITPYSQESQVSNIEMVSGVKNEG